MAPFRGLFEPVPLDGRSVLDPSILFAMLVYGIVAFALGGLIGWLTGRILELRAGFTEHLEQTRGQVDRIERSFASLGEKASAEQCPGIEGIIEEHDEFMKENDPSAEICDLFLTGAGARTEHYEIAAYSGLIVMARALGEREVVDLLSESLREEKGALKSLEGASRRLARERAKAAAG